MPAMLFADRIGALPFFTADLTFCLPKSRPSFAPALSDLVLQNRLRAAGRGSRSESVLRWADKRQIDPLSSGAFFSSGAFLSLLEETEP